MKKNESSNIVLVGLAYDSNLGDQAIFQVCNEIIKDIIKAKHLNVEIRVLDLYGRTCVSEAPSKCRLLVNKMKNLLGVTHDYVSTICNKVMQEFDSIIDDSTCCIIFAGGGLIKFSHQIIAEPMCKILYAAEKRNIPVMISAAGVEGFDENSSNCLDLKKAINLSVVKSITTRDDFELLEKRYITNKKIRVKKVADPACSISGVYAKNRSSASSKIGLGIGRTGLFEDYCVDIQKDKLRKFWKELYVVLSNKGYECIFFTNGLEADYDEAKIIVKELGIESSNLAPRPKTVEELISILSEVKGAVVTRLHSSIIAYSYGIPTIGLVWNTKQHLFGDAIGLPERFLNPPFDAKHVADLLEKAIREGSNINMNYCSTTKKEIEFFLNNII